MSSPLSIKMDNQWSLDNDLTASDAQALPLHISDDKGPPHSLLTNSAVGGFGSNNNTGASLFGAGSRPFGTPATSSGPSLFGASNTATAGSSAFGGSGGGAFGSNTGGSNTTPFGSSSNTGSLFGAQKPAFGGGGFGSTSQNSGPFGAQGTALGGNVPPSEGTAITPFAPFSEKDPPTGNVTSNYQSITFMQPYSKYSFEVGPLFDSDCRHSS